MNPPKENDMSTVRATTQLMKAKERIESKIEDIKSKADLKIVECEDELKQIDMALSALGAVETVVAMDKKVAL